VLPELDDCERDMSVVPAALAGPDAIANTDITITAASMMLRVLFDIIVVV
jgi:hypothetical protein